MYALSTVITVTELHNLSIDRLEDARALYLAKRYDGAFYICGYAIELGLKKKICMTLGWEEYPDEGKISEKYKTFKTHELEILLHLSGVENRVKKQFLPEWSIVISWKPEIRYSYKKQKAEDAELMLKSTETLLKIISS